MTRKLVHLDSELSAFDDSYCTCWAERAWCDTATPSTTACREILAKLSMRFNLTIQLPRLDFIPSMTKAIPLRTCSQHI